MNPDDKTKNIKIWIEYGLSYEEMVPLIPTPSSDVVNPEVVDMIVVCLILFFSSSEKYRRHLVLTYDVYSMRERVRLRQITPTHVTQNLHPILSTKHVRQ